MIHRPWKGRHLHSMFNVSGNGNADIKRTTNQNHLHQRQIPLIARCSTITRKFTYQGKGRHLRNMFSNLRNSGNSEITKRRQSIHIFKYYVNKSYLVFGHMLCPSQDIYLIVDSGPEPGVLQVCSTCSFLPLFPMRSRPAVLLTKKWFPSAQIIGSKTIQILKLL